MDDIWAGLNERCEDGVNKTLVEELVLSRKLRDEEAERFAAVSILLDELSGMIEDEDNEVLAERLAAAEAAQYVEETGLIVGVTAADIEVESGDVDRAKLVTTLEKRLEDKAKRLALVAGVSSIEKLVVEAANVAAGLAALAEDRRKLEELRGLVTADEQLLVEKLLGVAAAGKERVELSTLQADWLAAQAEGMACKMSLLEKRMMKVETFDDQGRGLIYVVSRKLIVVEM